MQSFEVNDSNRYLAYSHWIPWITGILNLGFLIDSAVTSLCCLIGADHEGRGSNASCCFP